MEAGGEWTDPRDRSGVAMPITLPRCRTARTRASLRFDNVASRA